MPIATSDDVEKFGTRQVLEANGGSVTSGSYGAAGQDIQNADDVLYGHLDGAFTFAARPTLGTRVDVFLQALQIGSGVNASVPSDDFPHMYVGSFALDSAQTVTTVGIDIKLPNAKSGQAYAVHLKNRAGQTLTGGWTLGFTPKATGPKA